ncbi:MAG: MoxR family ATPase [Labilithrix sp.]|nr:MoxR family ATPase [Labilithrix sp.]MCW5817690.1 MoxR family ATPase [Labilithrix sp.]
MTTQAHTNGHANGHHHHAPATVRHTSAPPPPATLEQRLHEARAAIFRIDQALREIILGQEEIVSSVVQSLVAGGHVLLEGAPGLGKTHLVRSLAQLVGGAFARIQFTPDLMPSDVLGTSLVVATEGGGKDLQFRRGPIFANLVLADEINRATPKTQSALLEAMAERTVSVEGRPLPLPSPFFVLATENPIEMEGVYPLPEAQLDRFLVKLIVKMPSLETLARIGARAEEPAIPKAIASPEQLVFLQAMARTIPAAPHVEQYAAKLVLATHAHRACRYGAGPRAMQALMACGRARALATGRAAVAIEDVAVAAPTVLRHRIGLRFEAEAEGLTADAVVAQILQSTAVT